MDMVDSWSWKQKKTLPLIGKCRIIIQIDILYGMRQNMLFCIILYGNPGWEAVLSAFHHENKIVVAGNECPLIADICKNK